MGGEAPPRPANDARYRARVIEICQSERALSIVFYRLSPPVVAEIRVFGMPTSISRSGYREARSRERRDQVTHGDLRMEAGRKLHARG
jgi:hypothetical protein